MEVEKESSPTSKKPQNDPNHIPSQDISIPAPTPTPAMATNVDNFMDAPYWTFNILTSKKQDTRNKSIKCSQALALAIKLAFESFIQGPILQMWGPRDNLGPTFSVPRQHRQLADKYPNQQV